MRRFMTFIAGAFCGALVGAVTALLLAPYAGEELRARTRDRIETFREEVREAYATRVAQLEDELATLRGRAPAKEE
jgi:gas vesicle protein